MRLLSRSTRLLATAFLVAAVTVGVEPAASAAAPTGTALPFGRSGQWITDAQGRAVVLHGLNQVYKVPPYLPSADGFGSDDAEFLHANGFNTVRVGVIWGAVEPQPGTYDDAYLAAIAQTVQMLGEHGIVSLLDFHQDLYSEQFQGEGAPAWAVQDGGLANPPLGFPGSYFANPAEDYAWDQFWRNAPAPDGVGLQDHLAAAWAHVAQAFRNDPRVFGYELLNEPWPGTLWQPCLLPLLGCPLFDSTLTAFYRRVVAAVRAADSAKVVWFEPNVLFNEGIVTNLGTIADPRTGLAFHDYCGPESIGLGNTLCGPQDDLTFANAKSYAGKRGIPQLVTEFGATDDLANLSDMVARADRNRVGWMEWAYTGNDKTSSSPNGQALVFDPSRPPTGDNVNAAKLKVLAEPYPQAVAGTPTSWSFSSGTFRLSYSTVRPNGAGSFPAGSETDIAVPAVHYPNGYSVQVTGGIAASAPNATTLCILSSPTASMITVTVTPPG